MISNSGNDDLEQLGAYAGARADVKVPTAAAAPCKNSCFGAIKSLSVTNILASDTDKTNSFLEKDFTFGSKKMQTPTKQERCGTPNRTINFPEGNICDLVPLLSPSAANTLEKVSDIDAEDISTSVGAEALPESNPPTPGEPQTCYFQSVKEAMDFLDKHDQECLSLFELSQNLLQMTAEMQASLEPTTEDQQKNVVTDETQPKLGASTRPTCLSTNTDHQHHRDRGTSCHSSTSDQAEVETLFFSEDEDENEAICNDDSGELVSPDSQLNYSTTPSVTEEEVEEEEEEKEGKQDEEKKGEEKTEQDRTKYSEGSSGQSFFI